MFSVEERDRCHRSRRNSYLEDFVEWIDEGIEFLKFSLPISEIEERSKAKRSVTSPRESFTCFWFGRLKKDVEKCICAYEWIRY